MNDTPTSNPTMNDTAQLLKKEIDSQDIVLFMKGTPSFPQCGFSATVVQILNHLNVPYKSIDVLADPDIRQGIKEYSDWPTIPQLYVHGNFVGGCDIVREMFQNGELSDVLANVAPHPPMQS